MNQWSKFCILFALVAIGPSFSLLLDSRRSIAKGRELPQSAFIWQREWSPAVCKALIEHRSVFERCIALNAEITWEKTGPAVVRVPLNYDAIRESECAVGLALRIGYSPAAFERLNLQLYIRLARELISRAKAERISVSELHLDFDCPESKLRDFAHLLRSLRQAIPDTSLTITALPSWLKHPKEFEQLLASISSYVLQVHSLKKPSSLSNFAVCDTGSALKAVHQASHFGKPFVVALPTYSYFMAFDERGQFAAIRAEQSWAHTETNYLINEVRSSPTEMSTLVNQLQMIPATALQGIIWYRLPTSDDQCNWSWETLESVMRGRAPIAKAKCELREVKPCLYEIFLINEGSDRLEVPFTLQLKTPVSRIVAFDGLNSFQTVDANPHSLTFSSTNYAPVTPRSYTKIGWFRLAQTGKMSLETKINSP